MRRGAGDPGRAGFLGWKVVWSAFTIAVFAWGLGFYGPPIFLQAVQEGRGWSVGLVSAAVTAHYLVAAAVVARLPALHARFGLVAVTRAGIVAASLGVLGWALADRPVLLLAATLLSGPGWAATGAAAINAMVSPWFVRRRPAALATAFNGASVGGVLLTPLWAVLIAWIGFPGAAVVIGGAASAVVWVLAGRMLGRTPAGMGQVPDGVLAPPLRGTAPAPSPPLASPWRERRFATLALFNALSLFAQIGLIAHLFSLMVPVLGPRGAGLAGALLTACAILGRVAAGALLRPETNRRAVSAGGIAVQAAGSLLLLLAGDEAWGLLLGVALIGSGVGNAISLPPLIAQAEFRPADTARVVALVTATGGAAYAFAPLAFGLLREGGGAPALFVAAGTLQLAAIAVALAGRGKRRVPGPASA